MSAPDAAGTDGGSFFTGITHAVAGVLCFAPGAVFVRMAAGINPLEITLHRMAWTAAAIFVYSISVKHGFLINSRREARDFALFGLVAALHFGCFVASLSFTKVSHALALCYTAPIFAALFSAVMLKERCGAVKISGIIVSFVGISILVGFEPDIGPEILKGDALALVSGITLGLYHTLGRMYREQYSMPKYNGNVYLFAAMYLFVTLMTLRAVFPAGFGSVYTAYSLAGVFGSTLFGTLLGHLFVNSALRRVSTVVVSLITTQEVTTGVIFAYFALGEAASLNSAIGILISLAGIAMVITEKNGGQ